MEESLHYCDDLAGLRGSELWDLYDLTFLSHRGQLQDSDSCAGKTMRLYY